jgi:hypothetical protein
VAIGVAAAIEMVVTFRRHRVVAWPASAMLTGNSIALLLRASGTDHGDWWSISTGSSTSCSQSPCRLLTKYLIRPAGSHLFNPSNGITAMARPTGSFLATLGILDAYCGWNGPTQRHREHVQRPEHPDGAGEVAVLVAAGNSFFAIWHSGPVTGLFYWATIVLSPETLIFVFFMMSDPQTAPRSPGGRIAFGAMTALAAVALIAFQPTEYGVKVALLSSLTVTAALMPSIEGLGLRLGRREASVAARPSTPSRLLPRRLRVSASVRRSSSPPSLRPPPAPARSPSPRTSSSSASSKDDLRIRARRKRHRGEPAGRVEAERAQTPADTAAPETEVNLQARLSAA